MGGDGWYSYFFLDVMVVGWLILIANGLWFVMIDVGYYGGVWF